MVTYLPMVCSPVVCSCGYQAAVLQLGEGWAMQASGHDAGPESAVGLAHFLDFASEHDVVCSCCGGVVVGDGYDQVGGGA